MHGYHFGKDSHNSCMATMHTVCDFVFAFIWGTHPGVGTKYNKIKITHIVQICQFDFSFTPNFAVETICFHISKSSSRLPRLFCEAVEKVVSKNYTLLTPMTMGAHLGVSAEDSELGDKVPPQQPYSSPFTEKELGHLQAQFNLLQKSLHEAVTVQFTNAQGKSFMEQFCNFLLPAEKFDCLRSTGPGNTEPGALNVTWVMANQPSIRHSVVKSHKFHNFESIEHLCRECLLTAVLLIGVLLV